SSSTRPVSSATSRSAASSGDSPPSMWPFGRPQFRYGSRISRKRGSPLDPRLPDPPEVGSVRRVRLPPGPPPPGAPAPGRPPRLGRPDRRWRGTPAAGGGDRPNLEPNPQVRIHAQVTDTYDVASGDV